MDNREKFYVGLDIGGTKCAVVVADHTGTIISAGSIPTDLSVGPYVMLKTLSDYARSHVRSVNSRVSVAKNNPESQSHIIACGITCGGPIDTFGGLILSPPNLPGWDRVPIVEIIREQFDAPVSLENDANACALAEWRYGAGQGCSNLIFLTFGTGMGAGLILDGRLYRGANDMAGEIGHVRMEESGPVGYGKSGSFEGFCSGAGIASLARQRVLSEWDNGRIVGFCRSEAERLSITTKIVGEAALAGDPVAIDVLEMSADYLGKGLAILIDIINPERIIIGSVFSRLEHLFRPRMEEAIRAESITRSASVCKIVPAALGEQVGLYAAVSVAVDAATSRDEE
jgi:glucokinase